MGTRALAHIEEILELKPIYVEGKLADNVEFAKVLDYYVVVKRDQFKIGDFAVYIEVDSILPEVEVFEFLRKKKFTIKAMKYSSKFLDENGSRIISQGILFKPSEVGLTKIKLGLDVTEDLKIEKVVEDDVEVVTKSKKWFMKYKLSRSIYRLYSRLFNNTKDISWLSWMPPKSDETNIQNIFTKMKEKYNDDGWYVTEKLEGQNMSIYKHTKRKLFGVKNISNGVCTRNNHLEKNDGSQFWKTALDLDLFSKVNKLDKDYFIRGEHCGPKIQQNIYKLPKCDFFVFEIYDIKDKRLLTLEECLDICNKVGFKFVPIIETNFTLPNTIQDILAWSDGKSEIYNTLREGYVVRRKDNSNISFKVRSPEYLTK